MIFILLWQWFPKINVPCPVSISTYPNVFPMLTIEYQHPGIHKFPGTLHKHSCVQWWRIFFCIPPFHGFQNKSSTFLKIHRCCSFVRNPMYTICILSGFLLYYIYIHNLTCFLLKSSCYLHRLQEQNLNDFIMITYSHRQRNRTAVLSVK